MKPIAPLFVALAVSSCAMPPRMVGATNRQGYVGPVPVEQLVRALLQAPDGSAPVRRPPFAIAVSPLTRPAKPARLVCKWRDGQVVSYRYTPPPKWNTSDPFAAVYEHLRAPDPEVDQFLIEADLDHVEQILFFDEKLVTRPGSVLEISDRMRTATYHVAYLCSQGSRVAIMLGYVHDPLAGSGHLIVLENSDGKWRFVSAVQTWTA